jgi:eukaryotic translation initiation factor 2C
VRPIKGVWRPKIFMNSNRLTNWIILNLDRYTREGRVEMQKMGRSMGMDIGPPWNPHSMSPPTRNTTQAMEFFEAIKGKVELVVVVVVADRGDCYAKVKQVAELNIGIFTQCVKARTMSHMNPATCSNILLKANLKLNGINHTLAAVSRPQCLLLPVMIVGADVTHAAVGASHDPKAFQYNIQIRLQPPRVEIIEDWKLMRKQLMFFNRSQRG